MKHAVIILGVIFLILILLSTPVDAKQITVEVNETISIHDCIDFIITSEVIEIKVEDIYHILPTKSTQFRIEPKIILNSSNENLSQITVEFIKKDKPVIENLKKENGKFIFDSPILVNGNSFYFPFDDYSASIYNINPPALKIGSNDNLPIMDERFEGKAYFMKDKINFEMTSNKSIKYRFIATFLIYLGIVIIISLKPRKELEIVESVLGLILGIIGSYEFIFSIGFFMFLIIIMIIFSRNYIIKLIARFREIISL